jgi:hypothetical protein
MMSHTEVMKAAEYRLAKRLGRELHPDELSSLSAQRDTAGTWQISVNMHFVIRDR